MSEVKWIKITTDIFENEKIKLIESMPQGYVILAVWFKILCLAGKQNNKGVFKKNNFVFTKKDLAVLFNMKISSVSKALEVLSEYNMICFIDGVITIPNWEKYQNMDSLERAKELSRIRMENKRKRQKQIVQEEYGSEDVTQNVTQNERNNSVTSANMLRNVTHTEEERDIRERKTFQVLEEERREVTPEQVAGLFAELCSSLGTVTGLNDGRRRVLGEALSLYSLDDFRRCFSMAEASPFLCGQNDRHWRASFDWLIDPNNMAKVLSGNYTAYTTPNKSYDLDEFVQASLNRSENFVE